MTLPDYFDHIPDDELPQATKSKPGGVKHPCEHCAGSGKWFHGRKCHACNGRGYFQTSAVDRRKKRGQVQVNKVKKLAEALELFEEQHPDLIKTLVGMTEWNDFAKSLVEQATKRGTLSEKQIAAAERMIAKTKASRAARTAGREDVVASTDLVDLGPIRDMFEAAVENGHQKPTYRAEDLVVSRASGNSRNPGCLYVVADDGTYYGKITAEGVYYPTEASNNGVTGRLAIIAADPRGAAIRYGRKTGSCSCCGRQLTNSKSIEAGIGPTCAANFGL